tara:strand:- start:58 stop:693 length:636 start_codon:yes stop_codon:yes gene_type:complete
VNGIYWDCDGTLMDTEKAFAYAWQEILQSKKLDLPIEHFDQYIGVDDKIVHKKFSSEVDLPSFDETMNILSKIILKNFGEKTMFDDALECLEYFFHYDWKQACVSASPQEHLENKLKDTEIYQYFHHVIGGDSVERNKPYPDIYLESIKKLGTSKNIIIEDSPFGIEAGIESGEFVIAIDRGVFTEVQLSKANLVVKKITPEIILEVNESL